MSALNSVTFPQCGVCNSQLGDTTTGTDVRIRNGLLSCYECYIASRGETSCTYTHTHTPKHAHVSLKIHLGHFYSE